MGGLSCFLLATLFSPIGAGASGVSGAAFAPPPAFEPGEVESAREVLAAEEDGRFFIREIRVIGNTVLPQVEVEKAVYPFLGPAREYADVNRARAALEEAYRDAGYQTVAVRIPPQQGKRGLIYLQVEEGEVATLRVRGSRYFDIGAIKEEAGSMAEGRVPQVDDMVDDLMGLNRHPDRRVTPEVLPGAVPGTVDIILDVEDTLPLHGSVELNNRYSAGTSELRLNGSLSYNNLWQAGHTIGGSVQASPDDWDDVFVYSGFYLAPVPWVEGLSLMFQYLNQDTDVSTIGGSAVIGTGEIFGVRATYVLPGRPGLYHTLTGGMDQRRFNQEIEIEDETDETPIEYYPLSFAYTGFFFGERATTDLSLTATYAFRGMGSDTFEFDANRFRADGAFFTLRGELGRTQELPAGFQLRGMSQGQFSDTPLISNEQYALGGMTTVRGYLEAEVLGDRGLMGSLELRSPNFAPGDPDENEARVFAFFEGGFVTLLEPLPEQDDFFDLASFGIGGRLRFLKHFTGEVNVGIPLVGEGETDPWEPRLSFLIRGQM